ncbi:MAG TPA: NB-ARC domain-containing protein, partial [Saprospiraceae bacterium]|nr:NB-ARC domain-containing protein [Saprospiraceae bacterium]
MKGDVIAPQETQKLPRYLSRKIEQQNDLLERCHLIEELFSLFDSGSRWVVIHGDNGMGKSTLANAFFHETDKSNRFAQLAWIPFALDLPKSIVKAISTGDLEDGAYKKSDAFYLSIAEDEIQQLRNYDQPQLLILDNVEDENAVLDFLHLLEIEKAKVIITSRHAFTDKRFSNFFLPPLTEQEVLRFFEKAGIEINLLTSSELAAMQGNPWVHQVLTRHLSHTPEPEVRKFIKKIFEDFDTDEDRVVSITQGILDAAPLDAAECWVLL